MKTKAVPAIIMLTAGLIDCILSIYCHLSLWRFTWQLLVVLVIFYLLGCVVSLILDKNFAEMEEGNEEASTDDVPEGDSEADVTTEETEDVAAGEEDE